MSLAALSGCVAVRSCNHPARRRSFLSPDATVRGRAFATGSLFLGRPIALSWGTLWTLRALSPFSTFGAVGRHLDGDPVFLRVLGDAMTRLQFTDQFVQVGAVCWQHERFWARLWQRANQIL